MMIAGEKKIGGRHNRTELERAIFQKLKAEHPTTNPIKIKDLAEAFGVGRREMCYLLRGMHQRCLHIFSRRRVSPRGIYYHECSSVDERREHLLERMAVIKEMTDHLNITLNHMGFLPPEEYKIYPPLSTEMTLENKRWILAHFLRKHCLGIRNAKPLGVLPEYDIDIDKRDAVAVLTSIREELKFPVFSSRMRGMEGAFWAETHEEFEYGKRKYGEILSAYKKSFHPDDNPIVERFLKSRDDTREKIA